MDRTYSNIYFILFYFVLFHFILFHFIPLNNSLLVKYTPLGTDLFLKYHLFQRCNLFVIISIVNETYSL